MNRTMLVLNAYPQPDDFGSLLIDRYAEAAAHAGVLVRVIRVADMHFDPVLHHGYKQVQALEPDLQDAQQAIRDARHIVIAYPTWWSDVPALLKGLIDRIILPGFAFSFRKRSLLWDKKLTGKSARIITTMDGPSLYYRYIVGAPGERMLKYGVLRFCGVRPVHVTRFDKIKWRNAASLGRMLVKAASLGARDAMWLMRK